MLRLVPIDSRISALADQPEKLEGAIAAHVGPVAEILAGVIAQTASHEGTRQSNGWGAFLAIDPPTRQVVGTCAFVHPPDADGRVEIAYFTFPPFEGRGFATGMVTSLIEHARRTGGVRLVYAHTLPEANASTRVLTRHGFAQSGLAQDHEVGEVWRWERAL